SQAPLPPAAGPPSQDRGFAAADGPGGADRSRGRSCPKGGRGHGGIPAFGIGGPASGIGLEESIGTFRGGPTALPAPTLFLLCPRLFPDRDGPGPKSR